MVKERFFPVATLCAAVSDPGVTMSCWKSTNTPATNADTLYVVATSGSKLMVKHHGRDGSAAAAVNSMNGWASRRTSNGSTARTGEPSSSYSCTTIDRTSPARRGTIVDMSRELNVADTAPGSRIKVDVCAATTCPCKKAVQV